MKKQIIGQSLHLTLGAILVSGAWGNKVLLWSIFFLTSIVLFIVHAVKRSNDDKEIIIGSDKFSINGIVLSSWALISISLAIIATSNMNNYILLFISLIVSVLLVSVAREFWQSPVERLWDSVLDVGVTVLGAAIHSIVIISVKFNLF